MKSVPLGKDQELSVLWSAPSPWQKSLNQDSGAGGGDYAVFSLSDSFFPGAENSVEKKAAVWDLLSLSLLAWIHCLKNEGKEYQGPRIISMRCAVQSLHFTSGSWAEAGSPCLPTTHQEHSLSNGQWGSGWEILKSCFSWHKALWLTARSRRSPVFLAAEVWSGISCSPRRKVGEKEQPWFQKRIWRRIDTCLCIIESLCGTTETNNIVNQLCPNIKWKF